MDNVLKVMLAILASLTLMQSDENIPGRIRSLVEAEKAFSALCKKAGFRDSFIANFADDGLGFQPGPVKVKERLSARPPEKLPAPVVFEWTPIEGDISEGGDMGYTTGPVLYTDTTKNPPEYSHAMYFSIWKRKDRQSEWKVVADIGVQVPQAVAPQTATFTNRSHFRAGSAYPKIEGSEIMDFDRRLSSRAKELGTAKAYEEITAEYVRLHQDGKMPTVGRQNVRNEVASSEIYPQFAPAEATVAISNDLAFTYGNYTLMKGSEKAKRGFYLHVWKKIFKEDWKLVAEIRKEAPSE